MSDVDVPHGFTEDPKLWCPCGPFPLVERGTDGETRRPAWFVQLPCAQEKTLATLAKASRLSRAEVLSRILAVALRGAGGTSGASPKLERSTAFVEKTGGRVDVGEQEHER